MLMSLPMFQGVSRVRLSDLVDKTHFHFLKYSDGETISEAGERCSHIRFVVSGSARVETAFALRQVIVSQTLTAPAVIGPDYMYGLDTYYPFSVKAAGQCGLMQLTKAEYLKVLTMDRIFLINLLNVLSRNSQKATTNLLNLKTGSVSERLAYIIVTLTNSGASDITLTFKQKDLCSIIGCQRPTLVTTLDELQQEGYITLTPTGLNVRSRQGFVKILATSDDKKGMAQPLYG